MTTDGILPLIPDPMIGPTSVEVIEVGGHSLLISKPADMERLIESEAVRDRFTETSYMPYWANIWPVSRALAGMILRSSWPARGSVLELGCGLGLAGIAALKAGHDVTFSDYDASALRFARKNAELNGFSSGSYLELNWKRPIARTFDVIIGADLTWDPELVPHMIRVFDTMLSASGFIWLADQDRLDERDFLNRLRAVSMIAERKPLELDPQWGWNISGSWYHITRAPR